eukprot:TRINITY_DN44482_c0_g1_i1.p1 TRINITY_DN44482_c0_g1~~TRINITY_DN44482_c0_g1_i1.p1  ORF type:complete len:736 (+),score=57.19 TRINITY_DN44482_c0_g1_i1:89-2209(+)
MSNAEMSLQAADGEPGADATAHRFEPMESDSSSSSDFEQKTSHTLHWLRVCIGACGLGGFAAMLAAVLLGIGAAGLADAFSKPAENATTDVESDNNSNNSYTGTTTTTTSVDVDVSSTTTAITSEEPCEHLCTQQAGLVLDPAACTPGRHCVYGQGWCREASHPQSGLTIQGRCFFAVASSQSTLSTTGSTLSTTSTPLSTSLTLSSTVSSSTSSSSSTTTPTATQQAEPCHWLCTQQRWLAGDPGACTPGRHCVFGDGWCREDSHALTGQTIKGRCFFSPDGRRRLTEVTYGQASSLTPVAATGTWLNARQEENSSSSVARHLEDRTYEDGCPSVCMQAGLESDPGACTIGRKCVYGAGWCRQENYPLPFLKKRGYCVNSNCGGPIGKRWPKHSCGSAHIPSLNLASILRQLVKKDAMPDAATLNQNIADTLQDFNDLQVEFESTADHAIDVEIQRLDVTWLVGCWPPQRYAVADATIRFPEVKVRIQAAGLDYKIDLSTFELHLKDLRVEIQCRGGDFVIATVGTGAGSASVEAASLMLSGGLDLFCSSWLMSWSPLCVAARALFDSQLGELFAQLPADIAKGLNTAPWPVPIADSDCPFLLQNTFVAYAYATQECCEAPFHLDNGATLIGGQFNGEPLGYGKNVSGVTCHEQSPGRWGAECHTVPGGYYQGSPGTCRESHKEQLAEPDLLPPNAAEDWNSAVW